MLFPSANKKSASAAAEALYRLTGNTVVTLGRGLTDEEFAPALG